MKLEDIRLGASPLTDRVYLGVVSGTETWKQKRDCTSDLLRVILEWLGGEEGGIREFSDDTGQQYVLEARKVAQRKEGTT
jgi:hypothetical protein